MRVSSIIAAAGLLLLTGCWTIKDFGAGKCREYRPACGVDETVCEADGQGCTVCTCVKRNGRFPIREPHFDP
ncbi:MAG: hypothetical protein HOI23_23465 [Deltaproteobacteria bacterium]|nr:hypothetical protein [Deltaproteobacteria bacterium]MBT6434694.1 hypothetical protein [Deltaproteobacteria bacterium]MBT6492763.1 hypothetical protein [Deltaproteobacteria bacterium]